MNRYEILIKRSDLAGLGWTVDEVAAELLEIYLAVVVRVSLEEKLINELLVLCELFFIGSKDDWELLFWYFAVFVHVEVLECCFEILPVVWGGFGQTSRYKLVVYQFSIEIYIHVFYYVTYLLQFWFGYLTFHVVG